MSLNICLQILAGYIMTIIMTGMLVLVGQIINIARTDERMWLFDKYKES